MNNKGDILLKKEIIPKKGLNPLNYKKNNVLNYNDIKLNNNKNVDDFLNTWTKTKENDIKYIHNNLKTEDINNKKKIIPVEKKFLVIKNKNKNYINTKQIMKTNDININNKKQIIKKRNNCLEIYDINGAQTVVKNDKFISNNNLKTNDININYKKKTNIKINNEYNNKKLKNKWNENDDYSKKIIKEEIYYNNIELNKPKNLLIPKKRNI